MQILHEEGSTLRVGQCVRNRGERWVIAAIEHGVGCAAVALTGADSGNHGEARRRLVPFDRIDPIAQRHRLRRVGRARWRRACRRVVANDGPPHRLWTAAAARMDLLPYQLEPAIAVVRGFGSRVLIADAVGLGKTVQAGLIVAELRARSAANHTLILTPAGVREQWVDELTSRFGLSPQLLDAASLRARQRELPIGTNPWATVPLAVASTDYVKRPEILRHAAAVPWDLVLVDEAHGCTAPSDRHAAVAALCRVAPHVVLLTATPHNGDERAFESLCGLGARDDRLLIFRRRRTDAGLPDSRRIHQLLVRPTAAERTLHASLRAFAAAIERDTRGASERVALVVAMLRKRALSSASSLERSLRRRLALLADQGSMDDAAQLALPFDADGELTRDDAPPEWRTAVLRDPGEERRWLQRLAGEAHHAAAAESKLRVLATLLRRIREPVVVFTEYRDTLEHVHRIVAPNAIVLHGGLARDERRAALARFGRAHVLLATDAAGEGLNLHHRSRIVINLELPWNPMRLEQRIGRVDRIGQTRRVHAFHLIASHSDEVPLRERLSTRIAVAASAIGAADPLRESSVASPAAPAAAPVGTVTASFAADAAAEADRLARARQLAPSRSAADDAFTGGPLVSTARRRVRVALRGRQLVVFVEQWTAWHGLVVASRVVPVLVSADGRALTDEMLSGIARWLPLEPVETGLAGWAAFWRLRRDRLTAIEKEASPDRPGAQPGLFDRRVERAAVQHRRDADASREDLRRRIDACDRWLALSVEPPAAALVLTSRA